MTARIQHDSGAVGELRIHEVGVAMSQLVQDGIGPSSPGFRAMDDQWWKRWTKFTGPQKLALRHMYAALRKNRPAGKAAVVVGKAGFDKCIMQLMAMGAYMCSVEDLPMPRHPADLRILLAAYIGEVYTCATTWCGHGNYDHSPLSSCAPVYGAHIEDVRIMRALEACNIAVTYPTSIEAIWQALKIKPPVPVFDRARIVMMESAISKYGDDVRRIRGPVWGYVSPSLSTPTHAAPEITPTVNRGASALCDIYLPLFDAFAMSPTQTRAMDTLALVARDSLVILEDYPDSALCDHYDVRKGAPSHAGLLAREIFKRATYGLSKHPYTDDDGDEGTKRARRGDTK